MNRFRYNVERLEIIYYFSSFNNRREPTDSKNPEDDRDVFNEKPSKEDIISATEPAGMRFIKLFNVKLILLHN